ncbi:MAG TPA: hypothetical protein VFT55_05535 [Planctomycetota bacterium]|nr:hypothetical protein [Planctomycetota bacterium]
MHRHTGIQAQLEARTIPTVCIDLRGVFHHLDWHQLARRTPPT